MNFNFYQNEFKAQNYLISPNLHRALWEGVFGLCTVLVLRGSRLFVPTFLLRLTAHDQPGHMDFNLHLLNTGSVPSYRRRC